MHSTKQVLLEAGLRMLLERGYNDLGIQAVLEETGTPKGSFYHHFKNKEDFALQVVDAYMDDVHQGLDACLGNEALDHVQRARSFFEATRDKYGRDGYLGCMLGGLGQELSGINDTFRQRIDACLSYIGGRMAESLKQAQREGQLPKGADPDKLGMRLVECWEGAALRCRLRRSAEPLDEMLDFYFDAVLRG